MKVLVFFGIVLLFSLVLTIIDKVTAYRMDDKSVWEDGDSVRIKRGGKDDTRTEDHFMNRLS